MELVLLVSAKDQCSCRFLDAFAAAATGDNAVIALICFKSVLIAVWRLVFLLYANTAVWSLSCLVFVLIADLGAMLEAL